jgi:hypothetical protein
MFGKFLQSICHDLVSLLSGIGSLALTVLSLIGPNGKKSYFIWAAAIAFSVACYRTWRTTQIKLEQEEAKNLHPLLVGEILEVQAKMDASTWHFNEGPTIVDYQVFVRIRVCNQNPADTTVNHMSAVFQVRGGDQFGQKFSSQEFVSTSNASLSDLPSKPFRLHLDVKLDDLGSELRKSPLQKGIEREGWLEFIVKKVPRTHSNDEGPELLETCECKIGLTDAFGKSWEIVGNPPWKKTKNIHFVSN